MSWSSLFLQCMGWLILPAIAVTASIAFFRGRRIPTRICCGRCGAERTFAMTVAGEACADCGATPDEAPSRPLRRWPWWPALPLVFLACTGAVAATAAWALYGSQPQHMVLGAMPQQLANDQLIQQAFFANFPLDRAPQALHARVQAGECPRADVRSAITGFLAASLVPRPTGAMRRAATLALLDPDAPREELERWFESIGPQLWTETIDDQALAASPPFLIVQSGLRSHGEEGLVRVLLLRGATLNGEAIPLPSDIVVAAVDGALVPRKILLDLPEEAQGELRFDLEAIYYRDAGLVALATAGFPEPRSAWPEPIMQQRLTRTATLPKRATTNTPTTNTP